MATEPFTTRTVIGTMRSAIGASRTLRFGLCVLVGGTLASGCTASAPPTTTPTTTSTTTAPSGDRSSPGAALLVRDGATVALTFQSGPGSTVQGSLGTGRFANTYRADTNTFGPAPVVSHTPQSLVFQTRSTTCTLATEGIVTCADGSRGSWNAI